MYEQYILHSCPALDIPSITYKALIWLNNACTYVCMYLIHTCTHVNVCHMLAHTHKHAHTCTHIHTNDSLAYWTCVKQIIFAGRNQGVLLQVTMHLRWRKWR